MARRPTQRENKIIDSLMTLVARQGWLATTLADVAGETGESMAEIHARFGSKAGILLAFLDRLDAAVVAGFDKSAAGEPARDRLFDVIMRRFDALKPYKDSVRVLGRELPRDPYASMAVWCHTQRTLNWMLETAHMGEGGCWKIFKAKGLGLIWGSTMNVWLRDDSEDQGRTMAHLDTQLRRADSFMRCVPGTGRKTRPEAPGPAAPVGT